MRIYPSNGGGAKNSVAIILPMYEEKKPQVLYICDRTKCKNCTDECHHTASKFYARDLDHEFVEIGGVMWEKPKAWDEWKLTDPRDGKAVRG